MIEIEKLIKSNKFFLFTNGNIIKIIQVKKKFFKSLIF